MCVPLQNLPKIAQRHITSQNQTPPYWYSVGGQGAPPTSTTDCSSYMPRQSQETSAPKRAHTNAYLISYNTHHRDSTCFCSNITRRFGFRLSTGRIVTPPTSMAEPTARYRHQSLRGENTRNLSPDERPKPRRGSLLDKNTTLPSHH